MPRLLLLLPAVGACSTQATTDGTTELVDQGEVDALSARLEALEAEVAAAQADATAANTRADDLEARLTDAEARLDAVEANQRGGDVSTQLARAGVRHRRPGPDRGRLRRPPGRDRGGHGQSSIDHEQHHDHGGHHLVLVRHQRRPGHHVHAHRPHHRLFQAHASYGYELLRLTLTSADGSWSASSPEVGQEGYVAETLLLAFGSFEPPEAGEYTFTCEGKYSYGWNSYTILSLRAAQTY